MSNVGLTAPAFSLRNIGGSTIFQPDGTTFAPDCLVHLQIRTSSGNSQWANTVSATADGSYGIKTGSLFNEALTGAFPYDGTPSTTDIFAVVAICTATTQATITPTTQSIDTGGGHFGGDYFGVDITVQPLPTWSIADQPFSEGVGNAVVEFVLSSTSGSNETVTFTTSQGTARSSAPNQDYGNSEVTGNVTVLAGATSTTTTIPIIEDSLDELDENFTITLSNPTGGGLAIIADGTGIITITDNDATPTIAAEANKAVAEGAPSATTIVTVDVTLSTASGLPVEFDFTTAQVTATANTDYDTTANTLTFAPGETVKTINVTVNGDEDVEGDETFDVVLSNATTSPSTVVAITDTDTRVTITDDDVDPDLSVPAGITIPVPPLGLNATATIPVTISQAWIAKSVVVTYSVAPNTAATPADYIDNISAGTVTIPAGSTSADIEITIVGDNTIDGATDFSVTVTNAPNSTISAADTTVVNLVEKPTLSIANATAFETSTTVTLTVSINPISTAITTVEFDTADGTATAGADYIASSATARATIPAGQSSATDIGNDPQ